MEHVVIIGNGISGVTAARHIRKRSNKRITIISAETEHFFSRTALMYLYMGHMTYKNLKPYEDSFWKKNRIDLIFGWVKHIDTDNKTLYFKDRESLVYDTLIISTGSTSNKFGWKGQDLYGVLGLYNKQDVDLLEVLAPNKEVCKRAVIVGGGLIGVELAEMLHSRNIPVTFLVREPDFYGHALPLGDAQLISRHILSHGIDLRLQSHLKEIRADENGRANAVVIEETGEVISCNVVGLTPGVSPNIAMVKNTNIETDHGILVNRFLETNVDKIYAIGDCAQQRNPIGQRKAIEPLWYTGRMMGETVAQTICGNKIKYKPGHWFNSAKFFNIEYQTYGWVFPQPQEGNAHFHWKHDDDTKCVTVEYQTDSHQFLGINTFGIRMKHEVFDQWLTEKRSVDHVMAHLKEANFEPELYQTFEKEIQKEWLNSVKKIPHE